MDDSGDGTLAAGRFGPWLVELQGALRGEHGADVPCGSCTACCTSGQFVHVGPEEKETLAVIPPELLFPAPGLPPGHVLMGYDEQGRCPMLRDGRCSIYAHRPRTCRTYDCRVFAAAGLAPDQPAVAERVERWSFGDLDRDEAVRQAAVRAAARFLDEQADLPREAAPVTATQRAVLAVEVHELFLRRDDTGALVPVVPDPADVRAAVRRRH